MLTSVVAASASSVVTSLRTVASFASLRTSQLLKISCHVLRSHCQVDSSHAVNLNDSYRNLIAESLEM